MGPKTWEYRAIQSKIDNLTAKVLGSKTSEIYIVKKSTFYIVAPLEF
jgi:hypothetical protein